MGLQIATHRHLTVSARLPLLVLMAAERRGVRRAEVLASAQISGEQLMEEDARISIHDEQAIWREAIDRTQDPLLGVDAICNAPAGFLGLPALLFGSASTLGDALAIAGHYMPLVHDGIQVRFEKNEDHVEIMYSVASSEGASEMDRGALAFFLAAVTVMGRQCSGRLPPIERLSLPGPAPATRAELARLVDLFGTEVIEFGASEPSVVLEQAALAWPSLAPAPRLHRVLKGYADELLLGRLIQPRFLLRAKRHLLAELEGGRATVAGLARRLAMGERSLQRRLASEGSSFAELLDDLRRELAPSYLRERELGLSEIAYRLGYRSPQSFNRAFLAWTGKSPGRWRRDVCGK